MVPKRVPGRWRHLGALVLGQALRTLGSLWPQSCFACARLGPDAICTDCQRDLPWLDAAHCPRCALPSPGAQMCGHCLRRAPHFDATLALFAYDFPVRDMVLAYKYGQVRHGRGLAAYLQQAVDGLPIDLVVPMPLHRARLAERGFNQSLELARPLAQRLGVTLDARLVERDINTPRLQGLRQKERQRAVRGAFRCTRSVEGLHVLVLDDVMTSGASLNELARTLKMSGAASVTNLVLARVLMRPRR